MSPWFRHSRIFALYLTSVLAFAAVSLVSVGVTRIAYLDSAAGAIPPPVFGQLLGLHRVLLQWFVVLPIVTAVLGLGLLPSAAGATNVAFPRVALLSWVLHVAGGMLVLRAVLSHGVEPGWPYAVGTPLTRDLVSGAFLAGLLLGALALLLTAVVLLATLHRGDALARSLFAWSTYWACWLIVAAVPALLSAIALAWLDVGLSWNLFAVETGGDPLMLVRLSAWAAAPLQTVVILQLLGVACDMVAAERRLSTAAVRVLRWTLPMAAVLSLLAVDMRGVWPLVSARVAWVGLLYKALLTATLCAAVVLTARALARGLVAGRVAHLYTAAAVLLALLFLPLDLLLSTPTASLFARGYLAQSGQYLVATAAMLMLIGVWHHLEDGADGAAGIRGLSTFFAAILALGLALTLVPMALMGLGGLLVDVVETPPAFLPLQTLVLFGGLIFAAGLALAVADLIARTASAARDRERPDRLRAALSASR